MVCPRFVPDSLLLSHVDDVFNAVSVRTNVLGDVLFYGSGAGKLPTASAMEADIMEILCNRHVSPDALNWLRVDKGCLCDAEKCSFKWFIPGREETLITEEMTIDRAKSIAASCGAENIYRVLV